MRLEIGKRYRDGWGHVRTVMGPTTYDATLVWTTEGAHYRQADGRYAPLGTPQAQPTPYDLDHEAEEDA